MLQGISSHIFILYISYTHIIKLVRSILATMDFSNIFGEEGEYNEQSDLMQFNQADNSGILNGIDQTDLSGILNQNNLMVENKEQKNNNSPQNDIGVVLFGNLSRVATISLGNSNEEKFYEGSKELLEDTLRFFEGIFTSVEVNQLANTTNIFGSDNMLLILQKGKLIYPDEDNAKAMHTSIIDMIHLVKDRLLITYRHYLYRLDYKTQEALVRHCRSILGHMAIYNPYEDITEEQIQCNTDKCKMIHSFVKRLLKMKHVLTCYLDVMSRFLILYQSLNGSDMNSTTGYSTPTLFAESRDILAKQSTSNKNLFFTNT